MTSLSEYIADLDEGLQKIILAVSGTTEKIFTDLPHRRGKAGTENIYGEEQKALDVWTNDVLCEAFKATGVVKAIVSEELGEAWINPDGGTYTVSLDPLDGSSNIESNNSFGTIVGVHSQEELLVPAEKLDIAFYNLYGPITTLVLASKKGVVEFVKHRRDNSDYHVGKDNITLPEPGKLMGLGGKPSKWTDRVKEFVNYMMNEAGLKVRYGGAFVGDINQIIYYGGCFMYPELTDKPQGKLRLVIECGPMSYIIEKAGGASSNGKESILKVQPKEIDDRSPVYVGNKDLIVKLEEILKP
ncbi:MAG: class 1 fructose-bisphosphatase [Methanobacteriota archaeon]